MSTLEKKPFVCKQCDKGFSVLGALKIHQRLHTGEKPFVCKQCDRGFSESGSLKKHQRVHTGEKPFMCKQCEKGFSQLGHLKKHQRVHSDETTSVVNSFVTHKRFNQLDILTANHHLHTSPTELSTR